jgi:hypothetical protein
MVSFGFDEVKKPEVQTNVNIINPALEQVKEKEKKKTINFQEIPEDAKQLLNTEEYNKYTKEEQIGLPYDDNQQSSSYLSLVLSPNLRDLEMMIRGLEYVKRYNPISKKEEIILRRIKDHPLNEYGINKIMSELKVYCSAEIKLGRKKPRDYYNSVHHVCYAIVRLIYKNLKSFGMDTQEKQRNAKTFCTAVIEMVDASFSRSIEGKENDLSRATEFKIEGNIDSLQDPAKMFNKNQKEAMKN